MFNLKDRYDAPMKPTYRKIKTDTHGNTIHNLLTTATAVVLFFGTSVGVVAQTIFQGGLNSISITDAARTNSPPTASFILSQDRDIITFDASGSLDTDGSISEYKWDFGDGNTAYGMVVNHQYTENIEHRVTLTIIDDRGAVALSQVTHTPTLPIQMAINFQPADAPPAAGYSIDYGAPYDNIRGYGWNAYMPNTRDRNNPISPDQAYDTNIMYIPPSAVWTIDVPNGQYSITICSGDPSFPTGTQNIQANGTLIISGKLSNDAKWLEGTKTIFVSDKKVTITFQDTSDGKLSWLKLKAL